MNMFNLSEHILYLANKNKGYIRNNHYQYKKKIFLFPNSK